MLASLRTRWARREAAFEATKTGCHQEDLVFGDGGEAPVTWSSGVTESQVAATRQQIRVLRPCPAKPHVLPRPVSGLEGAESMCCLFLCTKVTASVGLTNILGLLTVLGILSDINYSLLLAIVSHGSFSLIVSTYRHRIYILETHTSIHFIHFVSLDMQ